MHISNSSLVLMQKKKQYEGLKNILHLVDDFVDAIRACCLCAKIVNDFEVVSLSAIYEMCVYLLTMYHFVVQGVFFLGSQSFIERLNAPHPL